MFKDNSMYLQGILGGSQIDTAAEIWDLKGADVSACEAGTMMLNYEHGSDTADKIVGRVVYCKKLFSEDDCETSEQLRFFKKANGIPILYGIVKLFDGAGHQQSKNLAAIIRDYSKSGVECAVKFSVEGVTISKQGNILKESIIRFVSITLKPANKATFTEIISDPNAPEGFDKVKNTKENKDILEELIDKSEISPEGTIKLGQSIELVYNPILKSDELDNKEVLDNLKHYIKMSILKKAMLSAREVTGTDNTAVTKLDVPTSLTNRGAVKQTKHASKDMNTDAASLHGLSTHSDSQVRADVAWHPNTSSETLHSMVTSGAIHGISPGVAHGVAWNPNTSNHTLLALTHHPHPEISSHANNRLKGILGKSEIQSSYLDLRKAMYSADEATNPGIAPKKTAQNKAIFSFTGEKPKTITSTSSASDLHELSSHPDYRVKSSVSWHPSTSSDTLHSMVTSNANIGDLSPEVAHGITWHPRTSDATLKLLTNHPHPTIAGRARDRLAGTIIKSEIESQYIQEFRNLKKTISAGMSGGVAPSELTGGAALQIENGRKRKNQALAAIRDYGQPVLDKSDFKTFMKSRMPEVSDEYIDHFVEAAYNIAVKLKKSSETSAMQLIKFDGLIIDLQKAIDEHEQPEEELEVPVVEFAGQKVVPGYMETGDNRFYHLLHESPDAFIAVPFELNLDWHYEDLVKIMKADKNKYKVHQQPVTLINGEPYTYNGDR